MHPEKVKKESASFPLWIWDFGFGIFLHPTLGLGEENEN
jgi:hypothetical protein